MCSTSFEATNWLSVLLNIFCACPSRGHKCDVLFFYVFECHVLRVEFACDISPNGSLNLPLEHSIYTRFTFYYIRHLSDFRRVLTARQNVRFSKV